MFWLPHILVGTCYCPVSDYSHSDDFAGLTYYSFCNMGRKTYFIHETPGWAESQPWGAWGAMWSPGCRALGFSWSEQPASYRPSECTWVLGLGSGQRRGCPLESKLGGPPVSLLL